MTWTCQSQLRIDERTGCTKTYLDLGGLAAVVDGDALTALLIVAVVGEAHGSTEGSLEGADGLLAGALVHVAGILAGVPGDAGVVSGEGSSREGHHGGGEGLEGNYGGCWWSLWCVFGC